MADPSCARCGDAPGLEACFHCIAPLCGACWEDYGHCGAPAAVVANARARAWRPGDDLLPAPWNGVKGW